MNMHSCFENLVCTAIYNSTIGGLFVFTGLKGHFRFCQLDIWLFMLVSFNSDTLLLM